jgi:hypothetical protein
MPARWEPPERYDGLGGCRGALLSLGLVLVVVLVIILYRWWT